MESRRRNLNEMSMRHRMPKQAGCPENSTGRMELIRKRFMFSKAIWVNRQSVALVNRRFSRRNGVLR